MALPAFPYCKLRKAVQGPGNETACMSIYCTILCRRDLCRSCHPSMSDSPIVNHFIFSCCMLVTQFVVLCIIHETKLPVR